LIEVVIPGSVEVVGENCLAGCRSLSSVTFESGSQLSIIEERVLFESGLGGMILRTSVEET
jgi:hypothetical protein